MTTKGLRAEIYRSDLGDCSNGGISGRVNSVTIVNAEGPFEPNETAPAVELRVKNFLGVNYVYAVPLELAGKQHMMGGTYIATSDSRFHEAVSKLAGYRHDYPVALHDRTESAALSRQLSI